ncbi:unnamed protein product, partial [Ascophyllum nodosum]
THRLTDDSSHHLLFTTAWFIVALEIDLTTSTLATTTMADTDAKLLDSGDLGSAEGERDMLNTTEKCGQDLTAPFAGNEDKAEGSAESSKEDGVTTTDFSSTSSAADIADTETSKPPPDSASDTSNAPIDASNETVKTTHADEAADTGSISITNPSSLIGALNQAVKIAYAYIAGDATNTPAANADEATDTTSNSTTDPNAPIDAPPEAIKTAYADAAADAANAAAANADEDADTDSNSATDTKAPMDAPTESIK